MADAATAELAAVFGGVAFSGAALYGLAMAIRDANGFDERDERLMAERLGLKGEPEPAAVAQDMHVEGVERVAVQKEEATQVLPDPAEIEARVKEAQAWISAWKDKIAAEQEAAKAEVVLTDSTDIEARVNQVQSWIDAWKDKTAEMAAAAERKVKEAEERAVEAQRRVKEAEEQLARAQAEEERKKRVAHVRGWIESWREETAKGTSIAPPSLNPNPEMAAAVIKEMTEDTPVGVQRTSTVEENVPAMASVTQDDSGDLKETETAPRQRRVSITSEYEAKINSLISNYNASQERKKSMLPRETVTVDQKEMAAAEKEQAIKKANPIVLFFFRIIAMIQACFSFIKSLITGSGGDSEGPSTVAA